MQGDTANILKVIITIKTKKLTVKMVMNLLLKILQLGKIIVDHVNYVIKHVKKYYIIITNNLFYLDTFILFPVLVHYDEIFMDYVLLKNELEISRLFDTLKVFLWVWGRVCHYNGDNFCHRPVTDYSLQSWSISSTYGNGNGIPPVIKDISRGVKQEGMMCQ